MPQVRGRLLRRPKLVLRFLSGQRIVQDCKCRIPIAASEPSQTVAARVTRLARGWRAGVTTVPFAYLTPRRLVRDRCTA